MATTQDDVVVQAVVGTGEEEITVPETEGDEQATPQPQEESDPKGIGTVQRLIDNGFPASDASEASQEEPETPTTEQLVTEKQTDDELMHHIMKMMKQVSGRETMMQ